MHKIKKTLLTNRNTIVGRYPAVMCLWLLTWEGPDWGCQTFLQFCTQSELLLGTNAAVQSTRRRRSIKLRPPHHWKVEKAPAAVEKLHRYIVEAVVVIAVSKEDLDNENADPKLHSVATLLKSALSYSAAAAHAGGCLKLLLLQLLYGILICLFWKSNIFVPK